MTRAQTSIFCNYSAVEEVFGQCQRKKGMKETERITSSAGVCKESPPLSEKENPEKEQTPLKPVPALREKVQALPELLVNEPKHEKSQHPDQ